MTDLSVVLLERAGLLLVVVFTLTRSTALRHLLDRKQDVKTMLYYMTFFGIFGIVGLEAGVVVTWKSNVLISHPPTFRLDDNAMLIGLNLAVVVIAGLFGGPIVGAGAGIVMGAFVLALGGDFLTANAVVNPVAGLLSGWTARFFADERIIAPQKAIFIGMFIPILHLGLLLVFTSDPVQTISVVNRLGIPLVITNSLTVGVFTAMIRAALTEEERAAASETKRALSIAEQALPHLRRGLGFETARDIASLLKDELKIVAVAVTDDRQVLAHVGLASDHHLSGQPLSMDLSKRAMITGEIQIAVHSDELQCDRVDCPLTAAIVVPLRQSGEGVGLIHLYFQRPQQLRTVDIALARGLGKLLSNQLDVVAAEHMKQLIQEAELRNLQNQVQPHFLFNTLNLIAALIRVDPVLARRTVVGLGHFMRLNLRILSEPLISLRQEVDHLEAYLGILQARFPDQYDISCVVEDGLDEVQIPGCTLQPLVENSIKHGLRDVTEGGKVSVRIARTCRGVCVEVKDNGHGVPVALVEDLGQHPVLSQDGSGTGLYNVNQRLVGLLGPHAVMHIHNNPDGGCEISFCLVPAMVEDGEGELG